MQIPVSFTNCLFLVCFFNFAIFFLCFSFSLLYSSFPRHYYLLISVSTQAVSSALLNQLTGAFGTIKQAQCCLSSQSIKIDTGKRLSAVEAAGRGVADGALWPD